MSKTLAAVFSIFFILNIHAHEPGAPLPDLSKKQAESLETYVHGVYVLNTLEGPFPPYICIYSVFWEEYYYPVEQGIRHYLAHVPANEKKRIPSEFIMWWTTLDQLGCGNYDPLRIYHE